MKPAFLSLVAVFLLSPAMAYADDNDCSEVCEQYQFCASGALQAIYDGVFSGSGCSDYSDCDSVVQLCRAETGTCEAQCEEGVGG